MNELDFKFLREAFAVAQRAREHGNHPFGAILVDANGVKLLEAENTVITDRDCVGRLVYGLSKQRLSEIQNQKIYWQLFLPCREIFARGQREISVEGPTLEAEAESVHQNYWQ